MVFPANVDILGHPDYLPPNVRKEFSEDLIRNIVNSNRITRSDSWYLRYYREPYMETFSKDQFHSRWADIWDNITTVNSDGLLTPTGGTKDTRWIEKFTDLIAESQFRGGISSEMDPSEMRARLHKLLVQKGVHKHPPSTIWSKDFIFKFGRKKHIQAAYDDECIRFARSELYKSSEMNRAQKDDENIFEFSVMPTFLKDLNGLMGFSAFDRNMLQSGITMKFEQAEPYLVWCASHEYNPVIPAAFDYDSVLIIRKKQKFLRSVDQAIKKRKAKSSFTYAKVKYLDPYLEMDLSLNVKFAKHFRFSYQKEFRLAIGSTDIPDFEFIPVKGLKSFSDVVHLT